MNNTLVTIGTAIIQRTSALFICRIPTLCQLLFLAAIMIMMGCTEAPAPQPYFAGLSPSGQDAEVIDGSKITLPDDHASHPNYQLEWWYLTFVLADENGEQYGLQYTLFRFNSGAKNNWSNTQQWMAHASLHTPKEHYFEERLAAGGVGNAFVTDSPFTAVIDNWQWQSDNMAPFPATLHFTVQQEVDVDIRLTPTGPYISHGEKGVSKKTEDGSLRSYYYSQPFLTAKGHLAIEGQRFNVVGLAWYDHEWTSHLANDASIGWDWFSLHLNDGSKVMAFRMHAKNDGQKDTVSYTTGTYITPQGQASTLLKEQITIAPLNVQDIGATTLPTRWQISIPTQGIVVETTAFKADQWNKGRFPYYEGRVKVTGSHQGSGFMELTGY